jgi:hypothetical protein
MDIVHLPITLLYSPFYSRLATHPNNPSRLRRGITSFTATPNDFLLFTIFEISVFFLPFVVSIFITVYFIPVLDSK